MCGRGGEQCLVSRDIFVSVTHVGQLRNAYTEEFG